MNKPKYPDITVQLTGQDGNAFMVMGLVTKAMKRAKLPQDEVQEFIDEAMSGDYDNVLRTAMRWVDVN